MNKLSLKKRLWRENEENLKERNYNQKKSKMERKNLAEEVISTRTIGGNNSEMNLHPIYCPHQGERNNICDRGVVYCLERLNKKLDYTLCSTYK